MPRKELNKQAAYDRVAEIIIASRQRRLGTLQSAGGVVTISYDSLVTHSTVTPSLPPQKIKGVRCDK